MPVFGRGRAHYEPPGWGWREGREDGMFGVMVIDVRPRVPRGAVVLVLLAFAEGAACELYDPPPEARLLVSPSGYWAPETPLVIAFTEPIDLSTFVFDVRFDVRDHEGELAPEATTILEGCHVGGCGALTSELGTDPTTHASVLTITQNGAFDAFEGRLLVLVIHAGMSDLAGRERRVPTELGFSINPCNPNDAPVDYDMNAGTISLTAELDWGNGLWLHLAIDLAVSTETGRAFALATFARLTPGAAANVADAEKFVPDLSSTGWTRAFAARVSRSSSGELVLCSDPFDLEVKVANNAIHLNLRDFRVLGRLMPAHAAGERDTAEGGLTTSGGFAVELDADVPAMSSAWRGTGFREDELPSGLPRVCAPDPCATLLAQGGDCQLLAPWAPTPVCGEP